jgi:hypothetical protein
MATEGARPEPWRFCTICDPHQASQFSVERAYIKHLSSQRHLRNTNRPLETFACPDCGRSFSRRSEIHRHLINSRCPGPPGSRLITDPTTTPSKKHALSISPNGVPWKIHKIAACPIDAIVGSPPLFASRPAFGQDTDQVAQAQSRTDTQTIVNRPLQRLVEDPLPPRRAIAQVDSATSLTTLLLHDRRQQGNLESMALSPTCPQESTDADTQTSSALTDVDETEVPATGARGAHDSVSKGPTSAPENTRSLDTPFAGMESDKEVDQWLSDAMKSASLKEGGLAHVQVQPVISSTPAANSSSLGSLFLSRTPKVSTPRFSFPSPQFPTILVKSFARSAEIPAPMLTKLVEDGLRFAETSHTSVWKGTESSTQGVSIARPENDDQGSHLTQTASPPSNVDEHIAASTRSARPPSSTLSFFRQLVSSAPDLEFQRAREVSWESRNDTFHHGQRLLRCASTGADLEAYTILMKEHPVDINYWGVLDPANFPGMQYSGTALMVAAETGHYNVMYALLKASVLKRTHRLELSVTAMSLAARQEAMGLYPKEDVVRPFRSFLRTVVAILCCECPEETHASVGHDVKGYYGENMRPVLGLGDCTWCEQLWVSDWPGSNDIEEINECVREARAPITNIKRAFLSTKDWVCLEDD